MYLITIRNWLIATSYRARSSGTGSLWTSVSPFKLSRTPSQVKLAPAMGQHNEQICRDILGMSASQYDEFVQAELFA